jgi:hypothetical protein
VGFRRKERGEDAIEVSLIDSASRILDRHSHALRSIAQPGYSIVAHVQLQHSSLQGHALAHDLRKAVVQFASEYDLPPFQITLNKCQNFAHETVHAQWKRLVSVLAKHRPDARDDVCRSPAIIDNSLQSFLHLVKIGILACQSS